MAVSSATVLGILLVALFVVTFLAAGIEMIPASKRYAVVRYGRIQGWLGPGVQFATPFVTTLRPITSGVIVEHVTSEGGSIEVVVGSDRSTMDVTSGYSIAAGEPATIFDATDVPAEVKPLDDVSLDDLDEPLGLRRYAGIVKFWLLLGVIGAGLLASQY
jgi:hypothetical protein